MIRVNAAINRHSTHDGSHYDVDQVFVNWGGVKDALITASEWTANGGEVTGVAFVPSTPPEPENVTTEATVTFTRAENVFKNTVTFDNGSILHATVTVHTDAS